MPEVLVATDSHDVYREVEAALGGPDVELRRVRRGVDVLPTVAHRFPDLAVLDLQIGNMGGMATCLGLRLEEGAGRLPHLPVVMLLDRDADVFLARRSGADASFVKPLSPVRLAETCQRLLTESEGVGSGAG